MRFEDDFKFGTATEGDYPNPYRPKMHRRNVLLQCVHWRHADLDMQGSHTLHAQRCQPLTKEKHIFEDEKKYFGLKNSIFHFVSIDLSVHKVILEKKSILRHFAQNHKYLQLEKSTKYCKKRNSWHLCMRVRDHHAFEPRMEKFMEKPLRTIM